MENLIKLCVLVTKNLAINMPKDIVIQNYGSETVVFTDDDIEEEYYKPLPSGNKVLLKRKIPGKTTLVRGEAIVVSATKDQLKDWLGANIFYTSNSPVTGIWTERKLA